ncbi:odorant receptor 10-like isoform X2 [Temnothorax longispinosus]|uniref:odorant receptor 10-like isoform X2 n=1 Tax=Temnothorax longispinosus TaxID=300112 RepID=UPI003A98D7B6
MYVTEHSSYRDFVWAIELNRLGLELIGLWPRTNETVKNTFVSDLRVGMIFFVITFLSIIPLLCSFVQVWGDMILMIDNLQVTLPLIVVSLKLVIIRWKRTAVVLLVNMMAEDWMKLKIDSERDVMIRRARAARLIVICGYFLMIFVFVVLIVLPSFERSPQFELAFVIQATTMFVGAITYTSVDAFLGLTILHICGQLENFKYRLDNLVSCKDFDSTLRINVETHLRIIRFASKIEDIFTLMMLGLVFYFGILFCLFGFLLVTVINGDEMGDISPSRICFLVIGIFTLLAHTLLYCGAGEIIAEQCEAVYHTMCNLEWYKLESRKEKNLILLMIRANEPFRITAGKIFPLTMTTFCSLLKTSAGYISFLLAKR